MNKLHWYAAKMKETLLHFKKGEIVYVRWAKYNEPLAVGPVLILFNPAQDKLLRIAEGIGIHTVFNFHPNNVNPRPAPTKDNQEIEIQYRDYHRRNPPAKRVRQSADRIRSQVAV